MFFDTIKDYLPNVPYVGLVILVVIGYVGILWRILDKVTKFDDNAELFEKENWAYALQRLAICFAQIFAMLPALVAFDKDQPWRSLLWLVGQGLWVAVAIFASRLVVDWVVLPKINNVQLMMEGNKAVGIIEAGFYIGLGFLLNGSLTGDADTFTTFWASTAAFYLAGLAFVSLVFLLHEYLTPYNIREGIKNGHLPSAIETAGVIVAASMVTRIGVAGDFKDWSIGFAAFWATALISVVLLYVFRWVIDRIVLTSCTVKSIQADNLVVAATVMAVLMDATALAVSTAVAAHL